MDLKFGMAAFKYGDLGWKVITDEDFIIHVLSNLPKEYEVIFDGLDSCLTLRVMINWWLKSLGKSSTTGMNKLGTKKEKSEKETALGASKKQHEVRYYMVSMVISQMT